MEGRRYQSLNGGNECQLQEVKAMKPVQIFRIFEVVMLSLVTNLSLAVDARAQDRPGLDRLGGDRAARAPEAPQVLVAQGVGTAEPAIAEVDVDAAGLPPRDLTHEERLMMVAGLGLGLTRGTTTWRLTPAQALITGLANLSFSHVYYMDMISYGEPLAMIQRGGAQPPGFVRLVFRPPVSVTRKRYLIDCKVESGPVYQVVAYPDGVSQTFSNTSHLVVLYEAATDATGCNELVGACPGDATVLLRLESSNDDDRDWNFYSCEITRLD
jgi:hypothetical protein